MDNYAKNIWKKRYLPNLLLAIVLAAIYGLVELTIYVINLFE